MYVYTLTGNSVAISEVHKNKSSYWYGIAWKNYIE